jgi:hypothetical protein
MTKKTAMTDDERAALASELKAWRGETPQTKAAAKLDIPLRTLQGVEQRRGFAYPDLLRLAMRQIGGLTNGN